MEWCPRCPCPLSLTTLFEEVVQVCLLLCLFIRDVQSLIFLIRNLNFAPPAVRPFIHSFFSHFRQHHRVAVSDSRPAPRHSDVRSWLVYLSRSLVCLYSYDSNAFWSSCHLTACHKNIFAIQCTHTHIWVSREIIQHLITSWRILSACSILDK